MEEWEATCFFTGFNGPSHPGFCMVAMSADSSDPLTLSQAIKRLDWDQWLAAIKEELKSLGEFNTFEVCELPPGKRAVGCKYVFKIKYTPMGALERYKWTIMKYSHL